MPTQFIIEFDGVGKEQYDAVNSILGVDPISGSGDWPEGLIAHSAGWREDGRFYVTEVWSSPELQEKFMEERLGEALAKGGVGEPKSVTSIDLHAHQHLGS